jgi:hypothetical protein
LLKSDVYIKLAALSAAQQNYRAALNSTFQSLCFNPFSLYKIKSLLRFLVKSL